MKSEPTSNVPPVLPGDVLFRIFEMVLDNPQEHLSSDAFFDSQHHRRKAVSPSRTSFVRSIPLVNYHWYLVSLRVLYSYVELSNPRDFSLFAKKIRNDPELGHHTVTLIFTYPLEVHEGFKRGRQGFGLGMNEKKSKVDGTEQANDSRPYADDAEKEDRKIDEDCEYASNYSMDEQLLYRLFKFLPNLKHLCMKSSLFFPVQAEQLSALPLELELLCLHGFSISSEVLSNLPKTVERLAMAFCQLFTLGQPLELPGLRWFKWVGNASKSVWTKDTFTGCSQLKALFICLENSYGPDIQTAVMPLLPRLTDLHIEQACCPSTPRLKSWFEPCHTTLQHMFMEGKLYKEDVASLPASLRTFTWSTTDIYDMEALNILLGILQDPAFLPNLVAVPHIELVGEDVDWMVERVRSNLARKTLQLFRERRGLEEHCKWNDPGSLWIRLQRRWDKGDESPGYTDMADSEEWSSEAESPLSF